MTSSFVHLRVHSEYSLRDGLSSVQQYVQHAARCKMQALALTDWMNLFGLVQFYQSALAHGIKPIIGSDVLLKDAHGFSLCTLLCQNLLGYHHLTALLSRAYTENKKNQTPHIAWPWLIDCADGLLVLSGHRYGNVGKALLEKDPTRAAHCIDQWMTYFPNRYYIELTRTDHPDETHYTSCILPLAHAHQLPLVATNDIRFIHPDDFEAHEARVCIHAGWTLRDTKRKKPYRATQYFKTSEDMQNLFRDLPTAIDNTAHIAMRCTVRLNLEQIFLPHFPIPAGLNLSEYFKNQVQFGFEKVCAHLDDAERIPYHNRLNHEIRIIHDMGFMGYFLIVADFTAWAKAHDIPVGPGRGSGAGSLVAWALGITEIDPIHHGLLFERFLNPERISMPDFDIDFCVKGRDSVIEYLGKRYGHASVAQIITFGTMAAKAAVRDVGRVLGFPYGLVDQIAKLIPMELGMTLQKALKEEVNLSARYQEDVEVKTLIDLAMKLEGTVRNPGKHAGGVVIAPSQLIDFVPLYCEHHEAPVVVQFDKDDLQRIGLVKFDLLGLSTLTTEHVALQMINAKRLSEHMDPVSLSNLPLDDDLTFSWLREHSTVGIFQLESRGMQELIKRLKPDCFEDLVALVALFRPGPLQSGMVDDFIDRKHGRAQILYLHPELEPILQSTYGVILYQEQVMEIAFVLAGYTRGESDVLRDVMGKKKFDQMEKQRHIFLEGTLRHGVENSVAVAIFNLMEKFAGYGFNKSHSVAYAMITYRTAWLKSHYPAEFMAAVLSSDIDHTEKIVHLLKECRHIGLTVRPPSIQEGRDVFYVNTHNEIVYGLGAIKGVGADCAAALAHERMNNGCYLDLFNVCQRMTHYKLTRRTLEPLIQSGACDGFQKPRSVLLAAVHEAIQYGNQYARNREQGQKDFFPCTTETTQEPDAALQSDNFLKLLQDEQSVLGFYWSGHPTLVYEKEIAYLKTVPCAQLFRHLEQSVSVFGLLRDIRLIHTRLGKRMAVFTLEDHSGPTEITVFPDVYQKQETEFKTGTLWIVRGSVIKDQYTGGTRVVAEALISLDALRFKAAKKITIRIPNEKKMKEFFDTFQKMIQPFRYGTCLIHLEYPIQSSLHALIELGPTFTISPEESLLSELYAVFGSDHVTLSHVTP